MSIINKLLMYILKVNECVSDKDINICKQGGVWGIRNMLSEKSALILHYF